MPHNFETCKECLKKEENTLNEFQTAMLGSGMFTDFKKTRRENQIER